MHIFWLLFITNFLLGECLIMFSKDGIFHNHSKNRSSCLYAKKKKKSKKTTSPSPSTSDSAPRVTSNTNIPVRQQIAWARAKKRLEKNVGTNHVAKKFKKSREPKSEPEEYYDVDYINVKPPAIFVDGYNLIGYINKMEARNLDITDARDCLVSDLAVLQGTTGWFIEVVFDAYLNDRPESSEAVDSIIVTYTSKSETADNLIERRFQELRNKGFVNMVVVTDDNILREIAGSSGSGFLSCSMLLEELRIAYRGWEVMEEEMQAEVKQFEPTLADGLSDELKNAIALLKEQQRQQNE